VLIGGITRAIVCAVLLAALGCGSRTEETSFARPQTTVLNWTEAPGTPGQRLIVHVGSVTLRRGTWSVRASIENDTSASLFIGRPHTDEPGTFGLVTTKSAGEPGLLPAGLVATRYSPPLPSALDPGEVWSGIFSGPGVVRAGTSLRIVFGTFWASAGVRLDGRRHRLFRFVTNRSFRPS